MTKIFMKSYDDGIVTAFVVVISAVFLVGLALIYEGGQIVKTELDLRIDAQEAARLGAQQISQSSLYSAKPTLNDALAVLTAENFLRAKGLNGVVFVRDQTVFVQISKDVALPLFAIIGIDKKELYISESATDLIGVNSGTPIGN